MAKARKNSGISPFERQADGTGPCAVPDCAITGEYRAPRSRDDLRDYIWLCLEHVREYNQAWDYYAGMSATEIEAHRRRDTTWRRPSWPFGTRSPGQKSDREYIFSDPFGLFGDGAGATGGRASAPPPRPESLSPAQRALAVMDLSPPVTADEIRARYRELVKRLHPDANGGDKHAEERLKLVNHAYSTLKDGDVYPSATR